MDRHARVAWLGIGASLAVHAALATLLLRIPAAWTAATMPRTFELELDTTGAPSEAVRPANRVEPGHETRTRAAEWRPGGASSVQNVDTTRHGGTGDAVGAMQVIILAVRDDRITLEDSPMNSLSVAQSQRIATAQDRATREDRRATPHPADTPFLASGAGTHPERRPMSSIDPRLGARVAPLATELGDDAHDARASEATSARRRDAEQGDVATETASAQTVEGPRGHAPVTQASLVAGTTNASPGRGIQAGRGTRESESARIALGRPPVDQGPAATSSTIREARVRDDADAELLAASMIQSLVESSARAGRTHGAGTGGVGGGGAAGDGPASSAGGSAQPYGPGTGDFAALDTRDSRYQRWFLEQRARVGRELVFPRDRMIMMDQGTSVYRVVVRRDGTLANGPHLLRSSGFHDFDLAARAAIERSAPFPPLPHDLAPDLAEIHVTFPIEFSNPMVH